MLHLPRQLLLLLLAPSCLLLQLLQLTLILLSLHLLLRHLRLHLLRLHLRLLGLHLLVGAGRRRPAGAEAASQGQDPNGSEHKTLLKHGNVRRGASVPAGRSASAGSPSRRRPGRRARFRSPC
jgi:hypothetical protein